MAERQKHPGGRPRVELDPRQVEELARIGCTEADMAAVLGVSVNTIERRKRSSPEFRGVIEKGQASLRNSLRRLQVKKALDGNVTMLIWLGKQLLGQSDRQGIEHTGSDGLPPIRIITVEGPDATNDEAASAFGAPPSSADASAPGSPSR
jgi:hypothetical protein